MLKKPSSLTLSKPSDSISSNVLAPHAFYLTFKDAVALIKLNVPTLIVDSGSISSKSSSIHEVNGQSYLPAMTLEDFAELQHLVQHVLLPQMRSGNELMAYGAVCQLHVISVRKAWGGARRKPLPQNPP